MDWNEWFQDTASKMVDARLKTYTAGSDMTVDPETGALIKAGKPAQTIGGVSAPVMIGGVVLLALVAVYLLKD